MKCLAEKSGLRKNRGEEREEGRGENKREFEEKKEKGRVDWKMM